MSGLPWGALSLKHVVSGGRSSPEEPKCGTSRDEDRSNLDDAEEHSRADLAPYDEGGRSYCDYDADQLADGLGCLKLR